MKIPTGREQWLAGLAWVACALMVVCALAALLIPRGGINRLQDVAVPYVIAAVALGAAAYIGGRNRLLTGLLYAGGTVAAAYGLLLAAAVPLRLAIENVCPPTTSNCPLGYDRPITSAENTALTVVAAAGILAVLLTFLAAELRYRPRIQIFRKPTLPPANSGPAGES